MNLEEEVIRLRAENHVLKEQLQQRDQRQEELEQMVLGLQEMVKTLQERQSKDSHNSHLPPSSDRFSRQKKTRSQRKRSGKKAGGQEGHDGHHLAFSLTPDAVLVRTVEQCDHCQADLRSVSVKKTERRQVIDVPPQRLHITEYQAERKTCPHCQRETRASFPERVTAPVQYGPGIVSLAVYLVTHHLVPFKRAAELLSDVLGAQLREGTIQQMCARAAAALRPVEQQIKTALRQSPVIHQDESGLYVEGKRVWMHVTATGSLTQYQVHAKRGHDALDDNRILPGYQGTSVHDGWPAYAEYGCSHALCNVHLLRELVFLEETTGQPWTSAMQRALLAFKRLTEWAKARGQTVLPQPLQAKVLARYRAVLALGEQANPPPPSPSEPKRRGRLKHSPARNLLNRLTTREEEVLAFVRDFRVPFDNSQAERDIRMVKVQQKISGCFRSWSGAQDFCCIRGYLSTLRKQGTPLLSALQQALTGHPLLPALTSGPE